ncbi:hypothetical protein B6U96_11035 [Archaeoglobales archaeon ex4484_92]|nr:MAG: hypothetical protein B6U96_11035 [Archaeoglobales archaeon ex4484_92]
MAHLELSKVTALSIRRIWIPVTYISPKNTSKRCHRCGHVAQANSREFRCPKCLQSRFELST